MLEVITMSEINSWFLLLFLLLQLKQIWGKHRPNSVVFYKMLGICFLIIWIHSQRQVWILLGLGGGVKEKNKIGKLILESIALKLISKVKCQSQKVNLKFWKRLNFESVKSFISTSSLQIYKNCYLPSFQHSSIHHVIRWTWHFPLCNF